MAGSLLYNVVYSAGMGIGISLSDFKMAFEPVFKTANFPRSNSMIANAPIRPPVQRDSAEF
jgi:hypothetical protein